MLKLNIIIWYDDDEHQSVIYIDFAKAFDSVCHSKLLLKLKAYMVYVVHC